ncbi:mRNA capping enzyme, large subunit family protein [Tritrichomonas foetus]|uniref:mRNA cap guanine-N(7) methyltransferase n=1 Tax=Tritrichomonas foetus TaxID=1144522 RepID=A0A1J4JLL0_9EUKA|nr:mRNA capping enzyme, large subunit family protein [Tritrichomonas foetus]|eukprot:OHS99970.1 mRNA capping enzyme, large subunit family protein [Tritrichomonas foetus]
MIQESDPNLTVAKGYDERAAAGIHKKMEATSRIPHLSHFNNWIKSCLIANYCPEKFATIFDCACGVGGDMLKLKLKSPSYIVFGDISIESLTIVYAKYLRMRTPFQATFIGGDCFGSNINELIPDVRFHYVQCQFCFHYAFRTEELARNAVKNVCSQLLPGGSAVLTTVDACALVRLFQNHSDLKIIKNSIFSVERKFELVEIPTFGAEIVFSLVESLAYPEYLVHPGVIKALFSEFEMELVESKSFHEFYNDTINSDMNSDKKLYIKLLELKNGISDANMTQDEWDVIGLYRFYVFRKKGTLPPLPNSKPNLKKKFTNTFDVIQAETGEVIQKEAAVLD